MIRDKVYGKKIKGTVGIMGGIPFVFTNFMWSFAQMVQFNQEYLCNENEYIHYIKANYSYHAHARNDLCDQSLGDWLLMLDCDHSFDPDIVKRLLRIADTYQTPVLSGLYQFKEEPYPPVLFTKSLDHRKGFDVMDPRLELPENKDLEVFQVASAGAGCLLIQRWVLDKIKTELNERPFDITRSLSEDHSFFYRLERLKIPAFCAPKIECNHLVIKKLTISDYDNSDIDLIKERDIEVSTIEAIGPS